ncbi:MAG: hypothetical protein NTZ83_03725, partial [Candidatus Pacearchaeota archaeon]|nr:hypothetical protein [Candidatus Pacearchaeota archaeon]
SVDKSFCNDEAETVNPKTGGDDNKGFQKIFNSYRNTNYEVTSEYVLDMFREIGVQINAVVQNFNYHGENLKTHVGAIQELKSGVNILTNKIDTFSQIVDNLKIIVGRALNKNS